LKTFFRKYKHAWVILYGAIYFPWFFFLEKTITHDYALIEIALDNKIPFIEFFIIPYLFWFVFMAATVLYFFFTNRSEFYQLTIFLIIGMTLFLIISTLWPNGQSLRPTHFERDNVFVDLVKQLYSSDTPTNVFPSIHVYNTLGCYIAIRKSKKLKDIKCVQFTTTAMTTLIILSTMFLKQHSFLDVVGAGVFAVISYIFIYATEYKKEPALKRLPI
jgi:membrane-associated phospholipid phosphatase